MLGLIWIQIVWHTVGILKDFFEKVNLKKQQLTDDKKACKELWVDPFPKVAWCTESKQDIMKVASFVEKKKKKKIELEKFFF